MSRRLGHRPALDGVRAVAIVGVMGLHAIERLFPGGSYGVDVFFVLSAFLITSLIIEELQEHHGRFSFRSFYARRALRLGPALVFWLVLIAAPTAVAIHEAGHIPLATVVALFYVGDFAVSQGVHIGGAYTHIWSLAIEEQFYAIWPAAVVLLYGIRRRCLGWLVAAGTATALLVSVVSAHLFSSNYFLPTGHLVPLAAGVVTAYLFKRGASPTLERIIGRDIPGIGCLALLALIFAGYRASSTSTAFLIQVAVSVATVALILHLCWRSGGPVVAVMSTPFALWLGRRSYGLYLYHRTLAILIPALAPGITLRYAGPLVLILAFVVAEASFRLVERPINKGGRERLRQRQYPAMREAESDLPVTAG